MRTKLYTASAYHRPTGQTHVLRWATAPGYQSWPDDNPAGAVWWPWVERPADLVVQIPRPGDTAPSSVASGRLVLSNVFDRQTGRNNRPLNVLITDYVTDGWPILIQEIQSHQPLSQAVTIFTGVMGAGEIERGRVTIPVMDRSADFDAPLLTENYSGEGGLNGGEDLKDKTRERCIGYVQYLEPTYLGYFDACHWLSVNGGHPVAAIEAFGDGGHERPYVDGFPVAEQWTYNPATGLIRCGAGPRPAAPWARVRGDSSAGHKSLIGETAAWIVSGLTGKRENHEIDAASVLALDAAPRTIGLYCPAGQSPTIRETLDRLFGSIWGGFWVHGANGLFRVGRTPTMPTNTPKARYIGRVNCDPLTPGDGGGRAAKQVKIRFAPNFAPNQQPVEAATPAEAARAKAEYLEEATAENPAVASAWRGAAQITTLETLLAHRSEAAVEAALAAADLADPLQTFEVTVHDGAPGVDLTDIVAVTDDVAGFEQGGQIVVTSRNLHRRGNKTTLGGIRLPGAAA